MLRVLNPKGQAFDLWNGGEIHSDLGWEPSKRALISDRSFKVGVVIGWDWVGIGPTMVGWIGHTPVPWVHPFMDWVPWNQADAIWLKSGIKRVRPAWKALSTVCTGCGTRFGRGHGGGSHCGECEYLLDGIIH